MIVLWLTRNSPLLDTTKIPIAVCSGGIAVWVCRSKPDNSARPSITA